MDKDDVKHIGSYLEIYRYVAGESRTLDEIRKHLASIKVPASTINSQMKAISGKTEGLLKKNGDMITVDSVKAREVMQELNTIFAPLTNIKPMEVEMLHSLQKENAKLKKELNALKKKAEVEMAVDEIMKPKILLIDSVRVGEIEDVRDGVFINSEPMKIDQASYLEKYGCLRDSFYKELPDEKEMSQSNYRHKTFLDVFSGKWFLRRFKEMKSVKEVDSKKELSMKDCISQSLHVSKEEASAQIIYLSGRALSVQEILKNTKLTNQEKIALYAFNSPYRNTDLERLLNYAGDECPDANWLIALLEDPEFCNNYENVKNLIRQCAKASEWKMKQRLAEELISGKWFISANYNGVMTKFQLVPIEEVNQMRTALGMRALDSVRELSVKSEMMPVSDKAVEPKDDETPKKGSFVKTYELDADEIEEADSEILSYGEESEEE